MAEPVSWSVFDANAPEMAAHGRRLLYQDAPIATAFLATTAPDGGPRLHPVCPVVADGELWLFVVNLSPKYRDLVRNGRYALHTQLMPEGGEEFHIRGHAEEVPDAAAKGRVVAATEGRQGSLDFEALFRCRLASVLYTKWTNWGTAEPWPSFEKWRP